MAKFDFPRHATPLEDESDLKIWNDNKAAYGKWLDIRKASYKESGDILEFQPKQLTKASAERAGEEAAVAGKGVLQKVGQAGRRKLTDPIDDPGFWRKVATLGVLGTSLLDPIAVPALIGGSRIAATKGVQRALTGNAAYQRNIAKLLRQHPSLRRALAGAGAAGQATTIAGVNQ